MAMVHMFFLLLIPFLSAGIILPLPPVAAAADAADGEQFVYAGFTGSSLALDGAATITAGGLVELTNATTHQKGHAFHPAPLRLRGSPDGGGGTVRSFSVAFVCAIVSSYTDFSTHGLALVVAPGVRSLSAGLTDQYLGVTNAQNDSRAANHLFAVELDTVQNIEFRDISANHVGIDINGLASVASHEAGYYDDDRNGGGFHNVSLISRAAIQVWVDYDRVTTQIDVTMAPLGMARPSKPLVSATQNLSTVLTEPSYIGFSSSTGPVNSRHYVLGWSLGIDRPAPAIDAAKLPKLPLLGSKPRSRVLEITLPIASAVVVLAIGAALVLVVRRRLRYTEVREDWEMEFGPHRFAYKDLFHATDGFKDKHLLGAGGFGMVYKGVLPASGVEIAVKKVSHGSKQGVKEFVAEIVSIGRIKHRNLVQLLGYCRRKDELILVYDYMPNGSLDKYLYGQGDGDDLTLDWAQRLHVIKGVACGLHYLHERWEKVVVHRDVKTSNVLLDKEMNGRLGDFGLAKLYEHGTNPQTTRVVGTTGYLAPELVRTGKATPLTDAFAFGTFMLEVACGRRPIKQDEQGNQILLADWVLEHLHRESLVEAADPRLQHEYNSDEVCLILKIGLLCSHPSPSARPTMQQVLHYLDGELPLPEMTRATLNFNLLALKERKELHSMSSPFSSTTMTVGTISDLSGGR
ncbi:hypothetical protein CFC21_091938 [Triticum aestivum]|uniref:non-specific serine/threonine protein kinase n=2 Tax=Triticum aestivum TaxID=4565 RepID=A0A9R1MTJ4_WHEAT|nr:hypothetical protein CFC21_091938 [Triticum aestivum]